MSSQIYRETTPTVPMARLERHPILVATDGTDASAPALAMARLLAPGAELHVVSALEPMPVVVPASGVPMYSAESDASRAQELLAQVNRQAEQGLGDTARTPAAVKVGNPVEMIARAVRERRAEMVITGRRHHGRLGRLLRGETPLAIARATRVPVLVVPEAPEHLPHVAVIAVDLDDASVTAARMARPLLASVRSVFVVHVRTLPAARWEVENGGWEQFYKGLAAAAFKRVIAALELPAGVHVETTTLTGHPVEELLEFADFAKAELLVAGYRKRLLVDRLTGPRSVAERIFRATTIPMLLVPEAPEADHRLGLDAETLTVTDRGAWALQLAAFSYRNVGRPAAIEIDTADFGAHGHVVGYPLLGIDYDEGAGVVHVMLGTGAENAPHLTHAIHDPSAIEVHRRREGKDVALRVAHAGGYTVVTFPD